MFLAHGLTKLLVYTLPGTAQFFAKIGFAGWLAYPVTIFEVAAGVLLILGVWPRWVAAIAVAQLFVASTVHFGNGWGFGNPGGGWEYPIFLTVTAAVLALLGDGEVRAQAGPPRLSVRRTWPGMSGASVRTLPGLAALRPASVRYVGNRSCGRSRAGPRRSAHPRTR